MSIKIKEFPSNIEAEKAVLGSILLRPRAFIEVSGIINSESFYQIKNGSIFDAITELYKKDIPIDVLSIKNFLGDKITSIDLLELTNSVPSSINIKYYAEEVAKAKSLRDIIEMGNKITKIGFSEDYEKIPVVLAELQKSIVSKKTISGDILEIIEEFDRRTEMYKEKKKLGIDLLGLSCGYSKLDKVIDGLRKGHFWVLGGFTNLGKTTLSLNFTADLIKQGKRVVYYSLEMTDVDTFSRLLGIMCEENGLKILKGYSDKQDKIKEVKQKIIDSNFTIKTGVSEISEIMMSMYEENIKSPVDLFVIDYIQNVKAKGTKSEYETVSTVSVELQLNAQRLNIPVIALSQITNESAKNNDYQLVAGFKGSGAISASADLAMEIKIGEENNEARVEKIRKGEKVNMKLVISKNRHGSVGYVNLIFDGSTGVFEQTPDLSDF